MHQFFLLNLVLRLHPGIEVGVRTLLIRFLGEIVETLLDFSGFLLVVAVLMVVVLFPILVSH